MEKALLNSTRRCLRNTDGPRCAIVALRRSIVSYSLPVAEKRIPSFPPLRKQLSRYQVAASNHHTSRTYATSPAPSTSPAESTTPSSTSPPAPSPSSPAHPPPDSTLAFNIAPSHLNAEEKAIWETLNGGLECTELDVEDISGGCGSMYRIDITSPRFNDCSKVSASRLVHSVLGKERVKAWHGLQLRTRKARQS